MGIVMLEAALALPIEAALGYPEWLYRRLRHPVSWSAALITRLDEGLNRPRWPDRVRRMNGVGAAALVAAAGTAFGLALSGVARRSGARLLLTVLFATPGLAQRSLHEHVAAVARPLARGDLASARGAVAHIVGRDVEVLDASGVAGAALESLAESFNDGVVAPVFWLALAGLPGLYAYKAINTADSLIGHREPRWRAFGWAAARLDDLANLVPARIAGALIALAAGRGWRVMARDAGKHASPNAGWPEAAMAGALNVRLGGPARYDGAWTHRAALAADAPLPGAADLDHGLAVYRRACVILFVAVASVALARSGRDRGRRA
jgi:adenosylcobinamide-phosphate synthase